MCTQTDSIVGANASKPNSKPGIAPVLILCDNSGSMSDYVSTVNECLNKLVTEIKANTILSHKIDLSIASFNTRYNPILPFTMVDRIELDKMIKICPEKWATFLGTALSQAVEDLSNEKAEIKASNANYTQPNLIVISDGMPEHEDSTITNQGITDVQNKIKTEYWNCIPILIGHESGDNLLADIAVPDSTGNKCVIKFDSNNKEEDIINAFKFASMSVDAVGAHAGSPNYKPIPTNILKQKIRDAEQRVRAIRDNPKSCKKKPFWQRLHF